VFETSGEFPKSTGDCNDCRQRALDCLHHWNLCFVAITWKHTCQTFV